MHFLRRVPRPDQAEAALKILALLALAAILDWKLFDYTASSTALGDLFHVVGDVFPAALMLVTALMDVGEAWERVAIRAIGVLILATGVVVIGGAIARIGTPVEHPGLLAIGGLVGAGLNWSQAEVAKRVDTDVAHAGRWHALGDMLASLLVAATGFLTLVGVPGADLFLAIGVGVVIIAAGATLVIRGH
jgi:Co/Zn/Cd efflux system component